MARRLALVALAALFAAVASRGASAQSASGGAAAGSAPPRDALKDPAAPGEIEMEPAQTGNGPGSAAGSAGPVAASAAPAKDPKLAKKWLVAAQQLMQRGSYFAARNRPDDARPQFENAVTAYQRAIEVGDDPNVYLDLANAEDRLGRLDEAVKHLRRVTTASAGTRPDVVKKASARLDELLTKVGLVTLVVAPPGTSITLGGAGLGTAPLGEPLVLMPGTYTLSFQAGGFQPKEAEITVEPGTVAERAIDLEPVKAIVEPVAPVKPEPLAQPAPSRSPSRTPLYVGAGVTAAAALNAAIFGALAIAQHAAFTGATTSKLGREDARTNGKRFALVTDVSLGTAAVAAGITAYWYFYRYKQTQKLDDRSSRPVETKLEVVPWVQTRSGGAVIAGWF
jgi:hypothetical protein